MVQASRPDVPVGQSWDQEDHDDLLVLPILGILSPSKGFSFATLPLIAIFNQGGIISMNGLIEMSFHE